MSFLCFNPLSDVPNVTTLTPYLGFWALHPLVLASLCSPPHSSFYQLLSTPAGLFLLLLKYFRFAVSSAWNTFCTSIHPSFHTVSPLTILGKVTSPALPQHTLSHLLPLQYKSLSEIILKKKQTDLFSCILSAKSYPDVTPMRARTVLYHCMSGTSINIPICSVNLLNELVLATTSA